MGRNINESRLGVFVLERNSGRPLAGIPIVAGAEIAIPDNQTDKPITLGLLASDHAGYASFDPNIRGLGIALKQIRRLWVQVYGADDTRVDLLDVPEREGGGRVVYLEVARETAEGLCGLAIASSLISLQNPGLFDRRVSPNSFATSPNITIGQGACQVPLVSDKAVQEFRFRQVIRSSDAPRQCQPVKDPHCLELVQPPRRLCVRDGWVNEYRSSWRPTGYSLGQLVYSLPLAPCESVNLAVIEWSRQDEAKREEATTFREDLLHDLRRDRTIEETVAASLEEWQGGGSIMGGVSGAYGAAQGMSIAGAIGGAYSTSSGDRSVEATTLQQLADHTVQASTAIRNLQSTVVVSSSQQEREAVSTRTVTNHNHCHAMTVMYYEMLRHFQVVTEWVGRKDVLLVQYPLIMFQEVSTLHHRLVLERVLLDSRLRKCFRALAKKHCVEAGVAVDETQDVGNDFFLEALTVEIATGEPELDEQFLLEVERRSGGTVVLVSFERLPNTPSVNRLPIPDPGMPILLSLHPEFAVRWSDIARIRIRSDGGVWNVAHVYAAATQGAETWILFDDDVNQTLAENQWHYLEVRPRGGQEARFSLTPQERCCVQQLLEHLQAHRVYYSRAVWLLEDANQRAMRFDAIGYEDGRLLDFIENRPLAVYGNWVAFPKRPDPSATGAEAAVGQLPPESRDVVLPTRGIFAEAQLGHCNSCEERDITRFWDWSESPCPEKAPEIAPVTTGTRAQQAQVQPSTMPSSLVNIVNPPAAPDPTGLAAVMSVLGTPNIFRDMSGIQEVSALLQKLAEGTISLEQASNEAQAIQKRATGGVAGGPAGRPSPREQQEQLQVYRNAENHGELTPEQRRSLGGAYLQNAQYQQSGEETGPSGAVFSSEGVLGPPSLDNIQRGRILFADFAVNRTDLSQEHIEALDELVEAMQASSEAYIESIEGRASQTGPEDNNEQLGSGRANVVAQYLIDQGFDPQRIGRVVGYGSRAPLIDKRDVEVDINRSALITYSMLVDWPEPARRRPEPREGGSRQWAIRLALTGGAGHGGIGGAFAYGELRKGGIGGEVRQGSFQGFGLGIGASTPGASIGGEWTTFVTDAPYDFEDFDGTLARLTSLGAGFLVGYSFVYISFPNLGANSIYVGGVNFGSVGADGGVNPFGWWNVEGM